MDDINYQSPKYTDKLTNSSPANKIDPNGNIVTSFEKANYQFTPQDILYMKLSYAESLLYFTIAALTKVAILLMYTRIFYIRDGFHKQVFVASAIVVAWWIGCTVASLLTCRPLSFIWSTVSGFPDHCFSFNLFWMASGVCEILLDIMILALPVRAVMSIELSPRRKFSVLGIFLLGGL